MWRKQLHGSSVGYVRMTIFTWIFLVLFTRGETGHREDCDLDTFRKNLGRVCAVYIKRSAEYFMLPLDSLNDRPRKSSEEVFNLWGFYLKEFKETSQDPSLSGYLYQLSPEQSRESSSPHQNPLLSNTQNTYNLQTGDTSALDPNSVRNLMPNDVYHSADEHGIPHKIDVIPNNQQHAPRGQDSIDPFRRWRRNAMLKSLVVKCCSRGCTAFDFVVVAREYSICTD